MKISAYDPIVVPSIRRSAPVKLVSVSWLLGLGVAMQLGCVAAYAANADPSGTPPVPSGTAAHDSGHNQSVSASQAKSGHAYHRVAKRHIINRELRAQAPSGPGGRTGPGTKVIGTPGSSAAGAAPLIRAPAGPYFLGGDDRYRVPLTPGLAAIDKLRLRYVVNQPSVTDTTLGDWWGNREILASYGFGFSGLLTGTFDHDVLHLPTSTFGSQHYIGQRSEFDTSASYIALTYDLGRLGLLKDGLLTAQACAGGGTYHIYPHGVRLCALYVDQPLFNNQFDIAFGIQANSNMYANPLVGGSVATGSLGPSANILTELGLAAGGEGAPAINLTYKPFDGDFYNRAGVQRSTNPAGYVPEGEVYDPAGLTFTEPNAGPMVIDEVGYRHFATANSKYTWLRVGGIDNFSDYTPFLNTKVRQGGGGIYALADQQVMQFDPLDPRRGIYVGATFMYASPQVYTYSNYYEARAYVLGPFTERPKDQIAFVVGRTIASKDYIQSIASKYPNEIYPDVNNFTLVYGYHVAPGVYLNVGLQYAIHPTVTYTPAQGNPLLFRTSLSAYF